MSKSSKRGATAEDIKEEKKKQREHQFHNNNIQKAAQQSGSFEQAKAKYLERLASTGMSDAGINMLQNMVDQSMVLGNITEANVKEIKWWLQTQYLKIKALFPPKESPIQGEWRAYLYDDPKENITFLKERQKVIIAQMIKGIHVWVTRSKGGFQQEQLVKSVSVSEVRNEEEDSSGKLGGFFS